MAVTTVALALLGAAGIACGVHAFYDGGWKNIDPFPDSEVIFLLGPADDLDAFGGASHRTIAELATLGFWPTDSLDPSSTSLSASSSYSPLPSSCSSSSSFSS